MKIPNPFARWTSSAAPPRPRPLLTDLAWSSANLPLHTLAGPRTGAAFNYTAALAQVATDAAKILPVFAHLRPTEMLFTVTSSRTKSRYGLQARLTPMRFTGGTAYTSRRGSTYRVQRVLVDGREMLYLVTFCVPRFLDQPFHDKLVTLFHELYHISERFDGDLRRHPGRCHIHTHSQKAYDAAMSLLVRDYLAASPDPDLLAFLKLGTTQLATTFRRVTGVVVPRPKMLPLQSIR